MARPPKKEIDYSGWSVRIFDDEPKIDKLLDAQGWDGFGVYFFLCQRAYGSEGYFYKWSYADCATTARKMGGGIGSGTVKEAVGYCLQIGLFDKGLFDRWGILTSRGIQKRYWEVAKDRDVKEAILEYWLLQTEKCKGLLTIPLNGDLSSGNTDNDGRKSSFSPGNESFQPIKKSKVEESKNNYTVHSEAMHDGQIVDLENFYESIWELYPLKKGKGAVSKTKKKVLYKIGYNQIKRCVERYTEEIRSSGKEKYMMHGSTFFNTGYVDYLDKNYESKEKVNIRYKEIEHADRFSVLDSRKRSEMELQGVIDGQSLSLGNATDEQIKYLQDCGVL